MDAPFPKEMMECIETFLKDDHKRPPGMDVYEDCFQSPLFFPLQRREELRWMIRKAREISPMTVMEIGADKGAGPYHWIKCLPTVKRFIPCEIRGVPWLPAFERAFPHVEFLSVACSSLEPGAVRAIGNFVGRNIAARCRPVIDVLFIDGDKSKTEQDFDAYLPLMNPSGLVFVHDINDREPLKAYQRICARGYGHVNMIDISDTLEALDRERHGIPPANAHEQWLRHWKGASAGVGMVKLGGKKR